MTYWRQRARDETSWEDFDVDGNLIRDEELAHEDRLNDFAPAPVSPHQGPGDAGNADTKTSPVLPPADATASPRATFNTGRRQPEAPGAERLHPRVEQHYRQERRAASELYPRSGRVHAAPIAAPNHT